jgi:hypothetical protein
MSERTAQNLLRKLEFAGEISIQYGQGPKGCNLYIINAWNEKFFEWRAERRKRRSPRWGEESAGGAGSSRSGAVLTAGGAGPRSEGVQHAAPKPVIKPSLNQSRKPDARIDLDSLRLKLGRTAPKLVDKLVEVSCGRADGEEGTILIGVLSRLSDRDVQIVRDIVRLEDPDAEVAQVKVEPQKHAAVG